MLSSGKEQGCFVGEKEMFQREERKSVNDKKKRMLQRCFNGEKGFLGKKKVVLTLKKRDVSTVSTLTKKIFSTVRKKDV